MKTKSRLERLESLRREQERGEIVVIHSQAGRVTKGEYTGMTIEQVKRKLGEDDTLIVVTRSSVPV